MAVVMLPLPSAIHLQGLLAVLTKIIATETWKYHYQTRYSPLPLLSRRSDPRQPTRKVGYMYMYMYMDRN